jgi:hypothetical protein
MIPSTIATEKLAATIRRWILVIGGFFAVSCLLVSGSAVASMINASHAKTELVGFKKDIERMTETIERSKHLTVRMPKDHSSDRIQAVTDEAARRNHCELVEFQTSTELQPYTSKYSPEASTKGWVQASVQFQLDGSFTGVFEVIRAVCSSPEPVEVDVIEITEGRTRLNEVTAKVTMRLLSLEARK